MVFTCLFVAPCVNVSLPRLAILVLMCFVADATPKSIFGRGLELLWASVQDDAPVTAEVADQVPYTSGVLYRVLSSGSCIHFGQYHFTIVKPRLGVSFNQ